MPNPTHTPAAPSLDIELERLAGAVPTEGGYFLSTLDAAEIVEQLAILEALEERGIIRDGALVTPNGLEPLLLDRRGL